MVPLLWEEGEPIVALKNKSCSRSWHVISLSKKPCDFSAEWGLVGLIQACRILGFFCLLDQFWAVRDSHPAKVNEALALYGCAWMISG